MEIFNFILILWVIFAVFGLFIWMIIMQQQVSDLSKIIKRLPEKIRKEKINTDLLEANNDKTGYEAAPKSVMQYESSAEKNHIREFEEQIDKIADKSINIVTKEDNGAGYGFQKAILGNIFNKIGAVAIIVAMIIFIKLVSSFIEITPLIKVIFGFIAGGGVIAGSLIMHKKENLMQYSEVLLGTGFAILFITNYCAYSLFHLFGTWLTILIGIGFMMGAYLIADKMRTLSMMVIGLIGAYLTPFFAGSKSHVVLPYLIFINMISLIFTLRNKKTNYINIINLVITLFLFMGYNFISEINIFYPLVLWGIYIIYDLLRDKDNRTDTLLCYINYAVLTFFTTLIFKGTHHILGLMLAATAILYGVLSWISHYVHGKLCKAYDYSILINIWLLIYFVCNDVMSILLWASLAFLLSLLIRRHKLLYLNGVLIWYYFTTIVGAIISRYLGEYCFTAQYFPIFNLRTMLFLLPSSLMLISAIYILNNGRDKIRNTLIVSGITLGYLYVIGEIHSIISQLAIANNKDYAIFNQLMLYVITGFIYMYHARRLSETYKSFWLKICSFIAGGVALITLIILSYQYPQGYIPVFNLRFAAYTIAIFNCIIFAKWLKKDIFKYIAVVMGFFLCHTECVGIAKITESLIYLISVGWVLYSGIITITGILKNKQYLINTGIVLSILSIIRIFLYDLSNVDAIYKLIAFLVLGIILMLISYVYTSNKKNINK